MAGNRSWKLPAALAIATALGVGAGLLFAPAPPPPGAPADLPELLWPEPRSLGEFSLVDQDGRTFDHARLLGRWTLLFFGYTHCPDVCPVTLAVLGKMRTRLQAAGRRIDDLQVAFVSVDPARDSPAHLGEYVHYFDPGFLGVTGTEEELRRFTRDLGVLYVPGEPDANGDYPVDHSAAIFVSDPRGRLVALFQAPHDAARLAERFAAIRDFVEANG